LVPGLLIALLVASRGCTEAPKAVKPVAPVGAEVNLLAMGDWGADSSFQRSIARAMADYVRAEAAVGRKFDAGILAGDNFYERLLSPEDPNWRRLFEDMYDPQVLNFPFYAVLGNHDYQFHKDRVELAYTRDYPTSRFKLPARWYRLELPPKDPLVTVLMLDSNKQEGGLTEAQWGEELRWLEGELAKPRTTPWVMCVAHHPLYSNGLHGDNGVLQRDWGPLFDRYHVDFYVCGHDHDLEHIEVPNRSPSFLVVGGGGARVRPVFRDTRGPFSRSVYGFAHLRFTPTTAFVRFVNKYGKEIHFFQRTPRGDVQVVKTTGVEKATSQPLKVLQGLDLMTTRPTTNLATQPSTKRAFHEAD
jgi:hypothetical protein